MLGLGHLFGSGRSARGCVTVGAQSAITAGTLEGGMMGMMNRLRTLGSHGALALMLTAALGGLTSPAGAQLPETLQSSAATQAQTPAGMEAYATPAGDASTQAATPDPGLEAFVDGVVRAYMNADHIAGVTVAVVDRDRVLLQKGYGIAGVDPVRSVDPETTLFRIGSISKTFTYVAAMQLVAQGRIKLDGNANDYLPPALAIADEGFGPVTVENLMTHTAGFEDSALGHLFERGPQVSSLGDYLARHRPRRVRPPGLHAVYSNYSVALLGALVAQVANEPFERYVQNRLIAPLGTSEITFLEPLAQDDPRHIEPERAAAFSSGFARKEGGYSVRPFEHIVNVGPAGAGSASAAGMVRWMRMLLNGGTLDDATILDAASFERMTQVDFRNADAVAGIAHGFFRHRYGAHVSLEHAGATLDFLSNMVVLPDAGLGVFISTNTGTGRPLVVALPRLLFEHLLPDARNQAPPAAAVGAQPLESYAGSYRGERRAYTTLEKFFGVIGNDVQVSLGPDDTLVIDGGDSNQQYRALGDGAFRGLDDGSTVAFKSDATGKVTTLAGDYGHTVADRIGPLDSAATLALAVAMLGLLSIGVLIGMWHRRALRQRVKAGRAAAAWLQASALLWLGWIVLALVVLGMVASDPDTLLFDYPTRGIRSIVVCAYLAAAFTLASVLTLWPALRARDWSAWRKLRHAVVVLVMVFVVVLLVRWNVLFAPLSPG